MGSRAGSKSSTRAVPLVGSDSPRSIRMVVVLPAPWGPSRPKTSPCWMVRSSESTAVKPPYFLVSARARMAGGGPLVVAAAGSTASATAIALEDEEQADGGDDQDRDPDQVADRRSLDRGADVDL